MIGSNIARRACLLGAALVLATATLAALTPANAGAAPTPSYYVAMGDSLGAGVGATSGATSYVHLVYQHELARTPGLVLENFSCSGATTGSVINSKACGASVTQLAQATNFLKAHAGHIAFLTIDIGGNDVDGCTGAGGIDTTCIANGLAAVNTNLPKILSGLQAADPGIRIFGMNYYDPFLASWLTGASGQTLAQQSATQADGFNAVLATRYAAAGVPVADVATAFQTDNFALTGTYNNQTVPQNVANVCLLTYMCTVSDFHTDDAGHAVLAQSFDTVIDEPSAPRAVTATPGDGSVTVRWTPPVTVGSAALTEYVVAPFVGTTAQPIYTVAPTLTSRTITGLTNGTTYTFRVTAINRVGPGANSAPSAPIAAGAPLGPTGASAAPGNASATVAWVPPASTNGAPLSGYRIDAYRGAVLAKTLTVGIVTHVVVSGLTNGTLYTFRITANNTRGPSHLARTSGVVVGAPSAPTTPVGTAETGKVLLRWKAPVANGASITAYVVVPYIGGVAQPVRAYASAATAQTITGLSHAHAFTFRVAARNSRGTGPLSPPSSPVTPA